MNFDFIVKVSIRFYDFSPKFVFLPFSEGKNVAESEEDDDTEYFRQEVGEEPDEGMLQRMPFFL